jgi:hypothetical protein
MSGGGYGGKGGLFYGNFWGEFSPGLHREELSSVVRLD